MDESKLRSWALPAALTLLAFAAAAYWSLRSPPAGDDLARAPAFPVAAPSPAAAIEGSPAPLGGGDLLFEDFQRILGAQAASPEIAPIVGAFVKEFNAQPVLKATLERFQKAAQDGKKPTARAFIATLRGTPEFKTVASPFVLSPAGTSAFAALARVPQLHDLMRAEKLAMARAADALKREPPVGSYKGAPPAAGVGKFAPVGPHEGAPHVSDGARGASGKVEPLVSPDAGRGDDPVAARKRDEPRPDLKKLGDVQQDCGKQDLTDGIPWVRELAALGPGGREAFELAFAKGGLWGACFAQKMYARCKGACEEPWRYKVTSSKCKELDQKDSKCSPPDGGWAEGGYQSCLDWLGSDGEEPCIKECEAQPPCSVPKWARDKYPAPVAPGPEVPAKDKTCAQVASGLGWQPLCDTGNGVCGKFSGAVATSDCGKCCDKTGSCGDVAQKRGWAQPVCDIQGNAQCGGRGVSTWDCATCCETISAQTCEQVKKLEGWGSFKCGCGGNGVRASDCDDCCNPDW